jgi:hypothetical protein
MFNAIDPESGWKADLILRKARAFSYEEFGRRTPTELLGVQLHVATVGDVVLSKLEWAPRGGSARQLDDVRMLLRVRGDEIDRAYVDRWAGVLGVRESWDSVRGG